MTVSVIVPCHNAAPYLAQALGSVLAQTRPADEIIVVDDDSTDDSLAVALALEAQTGRVLRVYRHPCRSATRARNAGALVASGDALMFLDADDVLGPEVLASLIPLIDGTSAMIVACPWRRLRYEEGRWLERPPSCRPRQRGDDPLAAWLRGWYHPPCSVLWTRAAFELAGRWDELSVVDQDGDLMMRALALGVPFLEASKGTAYYRRHPGGAASLSGRRTSPEGLASRLRTVRKIAALLGDAGRLAPYRPALADAFDRIAADGRLAEPALARKAQALARHYGPSVLRRAKRRSVRVLRRAVGAARHALARSGPSHTVQRTPVPGIGHEVLDGKDVAGRFLASLLPDGAAGRAPAIASPAVTIVVPTYNRAHLLARALRSALTQTFGDFELLVIDDGSTDNTAAAVSSCGDERVRYLRQPVNAGVGAARNRGLREARGEYVALLDSDDEWLPQKLARQIARFRELPPKVGLLYCAVENVDGQNIRTVRVPEVRGDAYRELLVRNVIHGTSSVMFRRSVVAAAGFFDEGIPAIEDYDYWLRIARFFEFDFIAEPLSRYHQPLTEGRKSLNVQDNLDARWWFYRKFRREMRRAGVAHLFLLTSVRRALRAPQPRVSTARRLAARAVLAAPTSRYALTTFLRTVLTRGRPWSTT